MSRSPEKFQYHLITDHRQYRQPLHEAARLAEGHRVTHFQLREKDLPKRELLALAKHIRPVLERTKFIINGSLEVALASEADGLHLQKGNIPIHAVRKRFPKLVIGYSAHSREEILEAENSGADYVLLSPVHPSPSKSDIHLPAIGLQLLKEWITDIRIPVFALGGLSASNLLSVAETGCCGAAGISLFLKDGHFSGSGMVIND